MVVLPLLVTRYASAQNCGPLFEQDTLYACQGELVELLPIAEFDNYLWSTGSMGSTEMANQSGWYSLAVTDALCAGEDSVFVNLLNGYILEGNQSICIGDEVNLTAEIDFSGAIPSPAGFVFGATLNGHYYYVHPQPLNWFQARDACAQAGGHLITIASAEENALANSLINYSEHWVGMTDEFVEGSWAWITGEPVTFTNWSPQEPNNQFGEDYLEMYVNGKWNDLNGSQSFPFILEYDDILPVSVLWSNGDTDLQTTYTPQSSGYLSVQFFSGDLVCSDSILVEVQNPQFAFPLDTLKDCYLGSYDLLAPDGYDSYLWSTGSTESTTIISESGTYTLTVQEGLCTVSDEIVVELLNANIEQDEVLICLGGSATLSAVSNPFGGGGPIPGFNFGGTFGENNYYTSTYSTNWVNANTACINAGGYLSTIGSSQEQSFVYNLFPGQPQWFGFTDAASEGSWVWSNGDPITYTYWNGGEPNNSGNEDYAVMNVNGTWNDASGGESYPFVCEFTDVPLVDLLWSTGETTSVITVQPSETTTYYLQVSDGQQVCSDSVVVEVQIASWSFPEDSVFVCGPNAILDAGEGLVSFLWNTGSTAQSILVDEPGIYSVTVNEGACISSDELELFLINPAIQQDEVLICLGETATLSAVSNPFGGGGPIPGFNFGGAFGENNYYTSTYATNWVNANTACVNAGGYLSTIGSSQEQSFVYNLIPGQAQWIGFTDASNEGSWIWSNGDPITYTFWNGGEPNNSGNEDYAHMNTNGTWNDSGGGESYRFVCEFASAPLVEFLWSTGETTSEISVQPSETTTYYLQVSDDVQVCSDSVVVEVQVASWSFPSDSVFVCGPNATLDAGDGLVSFLWNTGATAQTIVVDEPGMYSVTVNEGACISSDELELFLLDPSIEQTDQAICLGQSVNLSTAVQSLGSGEPIAGFSYGGNFGESNYYVSTYATDWISASTACTNAGGYLSTIGSSQEQNFVYNLLPGQAQWIGFTDAASEGTWVWVNGDPITYTFWNGGEPNNSGNEDYAHMNTNGTWNDATPGTNHRFVCEFSETFGVDIVWSTSDTTQAISVVPGSTETYFVTVSDGIQICADSITITVETPIFAFPEDTVRICGLSTVLDAGGPFDTYSWSTGESSQTIEVTESGTYGITVDEGACTSSGSVVVSIISAEIIQQDTALCSGAELQLQTGLNQYDGDPIPGYAYRGSLTNSYYYLSNSGLPAAQAINACSGLGGYLTSIGSSQENQFVASMLPGTDLWIGFTDVMVEGQFQWVSGDPITYTNWGGGEPNNSGGEDYTHLTPSQLWNDLNGDQSYRYVCEFSNVQSLEVLWSTGETSSDIIVQPVADTQYWLQLSDGIGVCSDTVSVDVLALPLPDIGMDTMVVCSGESLLLDANVEANQYTWNTGGIASSESVNADGLYWVEVTDGAGCVNRDSVLVHFFIYPAINYSDTILCAGDSLELIVDAGNWVVEWSSGEVSPSLWVNPEDDSMYAYSINDGIGICLDSVVVAVSDVIIELILQEPTCYNYSDGSAQAIFSGGFGPYETDWSNDPNALSKGYHELIVLDAIGCRADTTFFVGEPSPLCFLAVAVSDGCNGAPGYAVRSLAGGTAPYVEDWGEADPVALFPGVYTVIVSDSQGCTTMGQVTMPESEEICGCMYENAANYNPQATKEDGSCIYTCQADLNNDYLINTADLLLMLVVFGSSCQ